VCGAAKPEAVMVLSYLMGRNPEPTPGCTLNAGQRGRKSVDLKRRRL